jgi:hypothetical protein
MGAEKRGLLGLPKTFGRYCIMVFFVFNQCKTLYFTLIIQENSLYLTGCIGVEEIPKNVQNI